MARLGRIVVLAALATAVGCSAPQKAQRATLFYPPAPELPRLQWLTSFTSARDIEPEKSSFNRFVVGEEKVVRRIDKPYGVAIFDGRIYVCDTNQTVMVFDLRKGAFGRLAGAQGPGRLVQPLNISIDADGVKYVTDPLRGQIVLFDRDDRYLRAYGAPGGWKPVDAVVYGDQLFVADMKQASVWVLEKNTGRVVRRIGREGQPAERIYMPTNLAFDRDGTLFVADTGKFGILKYDRDGGFKGAIGQLGTRPGSFVRPKGIALDREGRLYVVDAAFNNVQLFNPDRLLLMWFGDFGQTGLGAGNLFLPAKVVVDYDNVGLFQRYAAPGFEIEYVVLVTNQFGDHMVNVYGFGKQQGKIYPTDAELRQQIEERVRQMRQGPTITPPEAAPPPSP